ncbi:hypothetical protein Tco_1457499 [Tanacetum coccineum]
MCRLCNTPFKKAKERRKHEEECERVEEIDGLEGRFVWATGVDLFPSAVELLTRVQRVMNSNVMTPRSTNVVFNRIDFAIQKGLAAQLVARLSSPAMASNHQPKPWRELDTEVGAIGLHAVTPSNRSTSEGTKCTTSLNHPECHNGKVGFSIANEGLVPRAILFSQNTQGTTSSWSHLI